MIAWYPVQVFMDFLFSWLVLFFLSRKLQDVCTEQQETECLEEAGYKKTVLSYIFLAERLSC